jgi:lipoate-protein ligase A
MAFHNKWRLLDTDYQSPFLNMALEEALLRTCESGNFVPTIRFWANGAAVVIGRFQDVSIEVDRKLCHREKISIVRRFTGGGTVYHDDGNLNFTILSKKHDLGLEAVQLRNISVIKEALSRLGIEGTVSPPNSLMVNGKKISGSASAVTRGFILWHASLLISTDLEKLQRVLSSGKDITHTIHVRSRYQPTTSLQHLLGKFIQVTEVKHHLLESVDDMLGAQTQRGSVSMREKITAQWLHDHKYSTDLWNYDGQEIHNLLMDSHDYCRVSSFNTLDRLNLADHKL